MTTMDLYEIIIHVETDRVRARLEKYRVKVTGKNFLPVMLTREQELQGYSHRLHNRVRIDRLMVVDHTNLFGTPDHVYRSIYCRAEQRAAALELLRKEVADTVARNKANADKVYATWQNDSALVVAERKVEASVDQAITDAMV